MDTRRKNCEDYENILDRSWLISDLKGLILYYSGKHPLGRLGHKAVAVGRSCPDGTSSLSMEYEENRDYSLLHME